MLELIAAVITPPYCGVPKLSHQFPVEVVVVVTTTVVDVFVWGDVVVTLVVVAVVALAVVDIVVDDVVVVVDELQDANTNESTIRLVNATPIIPFFIAASFLIKTFEKLTKTNFQNIVN